MPLPLPEAFRIANRLPHRPHQIECVEKAMDMVSEGKETRFLAIHATGSGKSCTITLLSYALATSGQFDMVLVLTPRRVRRGRGELLKIFIGTVWGHIFKCSFQGIGNRLACLHGFRPFVGIAAC